jgi:hypothetical protein
MTTVHNHSIENNSSGTKISYIVSRLITHANGSSIQLEKSCHIISYSKQSLLSRKGSSILSIYMDNNYIIYGMLFSHCFDLIITQTFLNQLDWNSMIKTGGNDGDWARKKRGFG